MIVARNILERRGQDISARQRTNSPASYVTRHTQEKFRQKKKRRGSVPPMPPTDREALCSGVAPRIFGQREWKRGYDMRRQTHTSTGGENDGQMRQTSLALTSRLLIIGV